MDLNLLLILVAAAFVLAVAYAAALAKKTMHFCLLFFIVSWLTLGIGVLVWYHKISARIGRELARRNIGYSFGAGSYWGWNVLGTIIIVGPFVYLHKLLKAMNLLSEDFNING